MIDEQMDLLLVDDAPMIRRVLTVLLSRTFKVTSCADGADALALLQAGYRPAIVVTDYEMPVLDGISLTRSIRNLSLNCPIVMASSVKDAATRKEAYNAGVDVYLVKPISPFELKRLALFLLENPPNLQ